MFGIDDLIGGLVGAGASIINNQNTNDTNMYLAQQANAFNAQQAQINRNFQQQAATTAFQRSEQAVGEQEQFAASQADIQRQYETAMSNTAYQRATADMKAAGLNPILAYQQGGASTPSVSAPTGSVANAPMAGGSVSSPATVIPRRGILDNAISSAMEVAKASPQLAGLKQDVENKKSDQELTKAQTEQQHSASAVNDASAAKIAAEQKLVEEQTKNVPRAQGDVSILGSHINLPYWADQVAEFPGNAGRLVVHGSGLAKDYGSAAINSAAAAARSFVDTYSPPFGGVEP